jgi:hypothetical protein
MIKVGEYEVREPMVSDMEPIMAMMEANPKQAQKEMVKRFVFKDGSPIGENVDQITFKNYFKLLKAVNAACGFEDEQPGKD